MKYIDNTTKGQDLVSLLSVSSSETRHGIKHRLSKVLREIDGTYNLQEALHMIRCANAVIKFNPESELGKMIINEGLNIVDEIPSYNYIDTSRNPILELI